jgi:hypothetical protein
MADPHLLQAIVILGHDETLPSMKEEVARRTRKRDCVPLTDSVALRYLAREVVTMEPDSLPPVLTLTSRKEHLYSPPPQPKAATPTVPSSPVVATPSAAPPARSPASPATTAARGTTAVSAALSSPMLPGTVRAAVVLRTNLGLEAAPDAASARASPASSAKQRPATAASSSAAPAAGRSPASAAARAALTDSDRMLREVDSLQQALKHIWGAVNARACTCDAADEKRRQLEAAMRGDAVADAPPPERRSRHSRSHRSPAASRGVGGSVVVPSVLDAPSSDGSDGDAARLWGVASRTSLLSPSGRGFGASFPLSPSTVHALSQPRSPLPSRPDAELSPGRAVRGERIELASVIATLSVLCRTLPYRSDGSDEHLAAATAAAARAAAVVCDGESLAAIVDAAVWCTSHTYVRMLLSVRVCLSVVVSSLSVSIP